jgi:hypothetical protein
MAIATIKSTANGADDNSPRTEERSNGKLLRSVREAVLLIHYVTHVSPQCVSLIPFTPYVASMCLSGKLYGKGVTCITS